MPFRNLIIKNFRNLSAIEWPLAPGLNVLTGENAQGKTNLLEALYFLANGRSFRTLEWESLLQFEAPTAWLESSYVHGDLESQLKLSLSREQGKNLSLNDKKLAAWGKIYDLLRVLIFTPDSTTLFRAGSTARRRYLDLAVGRHFSNYRKTLNRYARVLRQRNQMLEQNAPAELREPFDQQWAELALQILTARREYLEELLPHWRARLGDLTSSHEELSAAWEGSLSNLKDWNVEEFLNTLAASGVQERRLRRTQLGPNREDLGVYFGERPVREVASQGQQRMLTIAMKLAEADLFFAKTEQSPIFLLDDIGSELDDKHLANLLAMLGEIRAQTVLTTAHQGEYSRLQASHFIVHKGGLQS